MPHMDDNGYIVDDYEAWLEETGTEDSEEARGWYDCPDGEQHDYIMSHQAWWNAF